MKKYILIFFLAVYISAFAQQTSFTPTLPQSPQSEAFRRVGEYSVNYSTGVPDISIPLFEIDHHGYKLPLSLKYNPSPLRPGYNYDVFGHGWTFSLSSCISRTINFGPDEHSNFAIEQPIREVFPFQSRMPSSQGFDNLSQYNFGHDDFNCVLPDGSSFDFYIEKQNGIINTFISNGRPIKITPLINTGELEAFWVVDENGITYKFEQGDIAFPNPDDRYSSSKYVSWHLTRIEFPNASEPITFEYLKRIMNSAGSYEPIAAFGHDGLQFEQIPPGWLPPSNYYTASFMRSYSMLQLQRITYGNVNIEFNFEHNNEPFETYDHNYVKSISISTIKEISLSMTEFSASNYIPLMKLDRISIKDPLGSISQNYTFVNEDVGTFNNSTDHWGYLNGNTLGDVSNFRFYAYYPIDFYDPEHIIEVDGFKKKLQLGNYNSRMPSNGGHGILRELKYPTGGHTEFVWEKHKYLTATSDNGEYISNELARIPAESSSYRIKEIKNYSADGKLAERKSFGYGKLVYDGSEYVHTGLGEALVDPNILTYMDIKFAGQYGGIEIKDMILGDFDPIIMYFNQYFCWQCSFSALNFRRLLGGRPEVLYPEVTVYQVETEGIAAGKSVYKYDLYDNFGEFIEQPVIYQNKIDYTPEGYRYNKLIEKCDFKKDGYGYQLIKKEKNAWQYWSTGGLTTTKFFNAFPEPYCDIELGWDRYDGFYTKWIDLISPRLYQTETSSFPSQTDSLTVRENYDYNSDGFLNKKTITNSNYIQEHRSKYPNDFQSVSPIIQSMRDKHILSPVISDSTMIYEYSPGPGKVIAGKKTNYKEFGNPSIIVPSEYYELEISSNNYILTGEIKGYSSNGNPTETVTKDGIKSCYIWGYNDRYMVASIKDAYLDPSGNIVSGGSLFLKSQIDAISNDSNSATLMTKLNGLRSSLPSSAVTTYTYEPLHGMTSQTDPNGVTSYYEYDGLGRLKYAKDKDQNILKYYEYNYKNPQ